MRLKFVPILAVIASGMAFPAAYAEEQSLAIEEVVDRVHLIGKDLGLDSLNGITGLNLKYLGLLIGKCLDKHLHHALLILGQQDWHSSARVFQTLKERSINQYMREDRSCCMCDIPG